MSVASSKAKLAGLVAHRDPADPAIAQARADFDAAKDERAVDDPAELARAARIVRIAMARGRLTLAPPTWPGSTMPPDSRIGPAATPGRSQDASPPSAPSAPTVAPGGELLAAALRYAPAWPVFPCKPDSKEPATAHGFKDASADPAQIRAWWRRWPDANIGIATGAPGPDVLDVDRHEDGDGFAAFNRLKRAGMLAGARALVRTRSGGLHAYFTGTGQPCGRLPAHHLDFKASGGYVLAPPSRVGGRPYELLDHRPADARLDWAAARSLLDPPRQAPARRRRDGGTARLAAWVAARPERARNDGLFWAACRAAESGCDPGELLGAAMAAGLGEAEARRTIASAARRARA